VVISKRGAEPWIYVLGLNQLGLAPKPDTHSRGWSESAHSMSISCMPIPQRLAGGDGSPTAAGQWRRLTTHGRAAARGDRLGGGWP
jgi:hypothetical protein